MTSPENIQQAAARHHGLPLLPRPTDDERDPLRWSQRLKLIALGATAFVNFTANFAGSGLSVAAPVLEVQFHKTANQVNALMTSQRSKGQNIISLLRVQRQVIPKSWQYRE
ncbi:unnamed protein product [Alternaria alternata]